MGVSMDTNGDVVKQDLPNPPPNMVSRDVSRVSALHTALTTYKTIEVQATPSICRYETRRQSSIRTNMLTIDVVRTTRGHLSAMTGSADQLTCAYTNNITHSAR